MRRLPLFILSVLMLSILSGCNFRDNDPAAVPKRVLLEALRHLETHDYDAYIENVDMRCLTDSQQTDIMLRALSQHQAWQEAKKGKADIDIVEAMMIGDTVCTVFYQLTFPDSTKEVSSQKMVLYDGQWRIRVRN